MKVVDRERPDRGCVGRGDDRYPGAVQLGDVALAVLEPLVEVGLVEQQVRDEGPHEARRPARLRADQLREEVARRLRITRGLELELRHHEANGRVGEACRVVAVRPRIEDRERRLLVRAARRHSLDVLVAQIGRREHLAHPVPAHGRVRDRAHPVVERGLLVARRGRVRVDRQAALPSAGEDRVADLGWIRRGAADALDRDLHADAPQRLDLVELGRDLRGRMHRAVQGGAGVAARDGDHRAGRQVAGRRRALRDEALDLAHRLGR